LNLAMLASPMLRKKYLSLFKYNLWL